MSRTVVHDPEHAPGFSVRGPRHDLVHQPIKGCNPVLRFAATEHPSVIDVEGGKVSPGWATVLMLDPHRPTGPANPRRMPAATCLDAGFLIRRDHELIVLQDLTVPTALIQIQNAARF